MEVPENRRWMYNRLDSSLHVTTEFKQGVKEFLDHACRLPPYLHSKKIRCPCILCKCKKQLYLDEVKIHLRIHGFRSNYYIWTSHGEKRSKYRSPACPLQGVQHVSHRPPSNQLLQYEENPQLEEGTGDSDEILGGGGAAATSDGGAVGTSGYITNSCGSDKNSGKRKRVGSSHDKKKDLKSRDIASLLSRIADASEAWINILLDATKGQQNDPVDATKAQTNIARPPAPTIAEVISHLERIPAIKNDLHWLAQCCDLMMSKPAREVYAAIKDNEDNLLIWLKQCYTPPPVPTITEVISQLERIPTISNDEDWFVRCCSLIMSEHAREVFAALKDDEGALLSWLKLKCYDP